MPGISDRGWWRLQRALLGQRFTDLTLRVVMAGGEAGSKQLTPALQALIDWDTFSQDAVDFANWYLTDEALTRPEAARKFGGKLGEEGAFRWATELTETTRGAVMGEVDTWVREGAPLPVLEQRLAPFFGKARAHRVAVTEVTRIYAQGNKMAWQASGVVNGMMWQTARDERVCPMCGPLHGTIVDLDGGWTFSPEMLANNPELAKAVRAPMTVMTPPGHVSCRCYLKPVVFEAWDPAELEQKRWGVAA